MVIIPILNIQSNHRKTRKNRNRSLSIAVLSGVTGTTFEERFAEHYRLTL